MIDHLHQAIQKARDFEHLVRIARRWQRVHSDGIRVYVCARRLSVYLIPTNDKPTLRAIVPVEDFLHPRSLRTLRRLAKGVAAKQSTT